MSNKVSTLNTTCHSSEDLINYLQDKGKHHSYYKVYSSIERISGWLREGKLYLSTGKKWNDRVDRSIFNTDNCDHINFGLCCSFSKSENVAMWMLYGKDKENDDNKNGAMLNITKGQIEAVINELDHVEFGHFGDTGAGFISSLSLERKDIEIFRQDVLYYSETDANNHISIKRSDERCDHVPSSVTDGLFILKKYPWNYENECRLVIRVKRHLLKDHTDVDTAAIAIPENKLKDLRNRVYASPNSEGNREYQGLMLKKSKLGEDLDW